MGPGWISTAGCSERLEATGSARLAVGAGPALAQQWKRDLGTRNTVNY